jgi:prepilin-type N-terminal cleavage/methylation domain-containing protein
MFIPANANRALSPDCAAGGPRGFARRLVRRARRAFTLVEVMVGVLVLSLLVFTLYRFVQTTLLASIASMRLSQDREAVVGLINFVQAALNEVPAHGQGVFKGSPSMEHDMPLDEMEWICQAGPGMLTTSGDSEYFVKLAIQRSTAKNANWYEIGLARRLTESQEKDATWLPLLSPVAAMEIRYYDPRTSGYVERWNDLNTRPALVRIRVWRNANDAPYEAVLNVPAANIQQ